MEHLVGYITIGLGILAVSSIFLARWIIRGKRRPTEFHRGVGMVYLGDSMQPWENWKECIDAVRSMAARDPDYNVVKDFWVEVIPYHHALTNKHIRTGWYVPERPWYHVPRPTTSEEVDKHGIRRVVGSVKVEQYMFFTKKHYVIQLVQMRKSTFRVHGVLGTFGEGIVPMEESAFFYEFAKRLRDFVISEGNYLGEIQVIDEDENVMEKAIRHVYNEEKTA